MKKLIGLSLVVAALAPFAAQAATTRSELWRDRQDVREERREYRDAVRYGSPRDIREERKEYRDSVREYREDLQDWREDRRRGYVRGNRRGHWNAPFGYTAYRPGWRAHHGAFHSRYFINDPWRHGLPHARGPYRWVRHYDDALLIDVRTGGVRRVIRGFYW